ncbi:sodium:solute symporter family protein [Lignipirellula cremea]|uniref:Sodium/proline symporter n=1 Tax=Lignipirellula cremea TaxID=2528010 RepID=A0A518DQR5_9BACT|nr:sodium:solute symporter family protein [Lignipirellula cremea]QDU94183.1 Sodium/proline symporter [Lignipirellula cremea]
MTQLIIISVYLLLLVVLGMFSSRLFRGTSEDYLLASHSIGPFVLLMSIFGTTMTAFALVGSTGESYTQGVGVYGLLASSSGIVHSLCIFVIGVKMWTFGRKYGYSTQVQFFRDRLESDRIGLLLFPILVGLVIPYLLIGVIASGVVVSAVTEGAFTNEFFAAYDYGVPNWAGSFVICLVVLIYVFFGGMRGAAWANTFQTIVFMALGVATFVLLANKLGGPVEASQKVLEKHPSKMMRAVAPQEETAYQTALEAWRRTAEKAYAGAHSLAETDLTLQQQTLAWLEQDDRVLPEGQSTLDADGKPLPLSHFPRSADWPKKAMKLFGAKVGHPAQPLNPDDPSQGKKWTIKKAHGVYKATHWAPEEPRPMSHWRFLSYLLVPLSIGMFPHLFQHWLTAKSANSFKLPVIVHPLFIAIVWTPCVLVGVWATIAVSDTGIPVIPPHFNPNAVLSKMVNDLTGPIVGGFLTAGILAAIMSSLDSQFLCLGTMFTTDIVVHYGGKNRFTDRQQITLARGFIVAIVAVTYAFSLFEPARVFQMGVWCFSGFAALVPLIVAAIYWPRLTKAGAYACVLTASVLWSVMFWQADFAMNDEYSALGFGVLPVTWMVLGSTVALVGVSLVTRPPGKATLEKFFDESAS